MPEAEWRREFEKLMIELAQVSAEIRPSKSGADPRRRQVASSHHSTRVALRTAA